MKLNDIPKASAVSLEWERMCALTEQRRYPETSRYYVRQAKRIARLDRQIAATADRHIAHLRKQMQKHIGLGNTKAASSYAVRILEVELMAGETAADIAEGSMNAGFLWHNESDPNVEVIGRYADDQHDACDGMGIVRAGDEWELCHCTMAALMAAQPEALPLRLVQNAHRNGAMEQ